MRPQHNKHFHISLVLGEICFEKLVGLPIGNSIIFLSEDYPTIGFPSAFLRFLVCGVKLFWIIQIVLTSVFRTIKINITVSIGISKLNENISLENAIMNADNAMYLSKADGRNKTSIY